MTHGCLVVRAWGERRRLLLHTYHSGMNIPHAVEQALPSRARKRVSYLAEWYFRRRYTTRERLWDTLRSDALTDGAGFPPSASAWIISASPGLLEPTPWSFVKDLPEWSGVDHPYTLAISDYEWILKGQHGELLAAYDVAAVMFEAVWQMVRRSRKPPRPGDRENAAATAGKEVDDAGSWR